MDAEALTSLSLSACNRLKTISSPSQCSLSEFIKYSETEEIKICRKNYKCKLISK